MRKNHRNVYEEHIDYLKLYVQNLYKYLMIDYTNQVRILFKYKKWLHPPNMCGQLALEADWEKRNKVVTENVIRKSIQDGLHETIQDELNLKDEDYLLVSDESFN